MKLPFAKYPSIAFASVIFAFASFGAENNQNEDKTMKYTLTPLEYPENALEPWIDAETVALHHGKHQAAYVEKLNAALASEPSFKFDGSVCELISNLDAVPVSIRAAESRTTNFTGAGCLRRRPTRRTSFYAQLRIRSGLSRISGRR